MEYGFKGTILKEGIRTFIVIPFNVWEVCGQEGMIPVKVIIDNIDFECKLVPKGGGNYYIPIAKSILKAIENPAEFEVSFKIINGLTRINSNSPYSIENPIRKIDRLEIIIQPQSGMCGQACVAMLAGVSLEEVVNVMKSKRWQGSLSKVVETLDYYGIAHAPKMFYMGNKVNELPKCCIINARFEKGSHLLIFHNGKYYDPSLGILEEYDINRIIGYLEIIIE